MASRVYLHVGLPKTGTTYLQSVLWDNKPALAEQGILLPGNSARDHMWATLVVREHGRIGDRAPAAQTSWQRLVDEVRAHPGPAVISHEFFGAATEAQAAQAVAALGCEVHLVVTARDVLTVVASYWQEYVKHGWFDLALDEFPEPGRGYEEWTWRTLDLRKVLERWSSAIPAERVHVLVLPDASAPRDALWTEFAAILGIEGAEEFDLERARENSSLSVVEAEFMRRFASGLADFDNALDRGVWLRGYLSHRVLVPRAGERPRPSDERIEELRAIADDAVDWLAGTGFDIRGDVERLRVPAEVPGRDPSSVTDDEIREVALDTARRLLTDMREIRRENTRLRREAGERDTAAPTRRTVLGRIRSRRAD
ncbi:hypothetical protein [Nocardioides jiangxiensis]|uniref:Sulfotransferase family protein n=1 Tax=Nocardioides jiangxiensis TaxID=3064524 RepID=A0ABT9AY15_9ACTN|nr:hypothetical protein [Nocardioides sp. WY-20]MDO7867455.1 hypothetical protein [Nocardioides sp. WY-20]